MVTDRYEAGTATVERLPLAYTGTRANAPRPPRSQRKERAVRAQRRNVFIARHRHGHCDMTTFSPAEFTFAVLWNQLELLAQQACL